MSGSQQWSMWGQKLVNKFSPETVSIFAVEANGEVGWPPEYVELITRILSNKIFAESRGCVAVTNLGGRIRQLGLTVPDWNMVTRVNREAFKLQGRNAIDSAETFQQQVYATLQTLASYGIRSSEVIHKEVVILGNFATHSVNLDMLAALTTEAENQRVMLKFIFPDNAHEGSQVQRQNYELAWEFRDTTDYYRIHTREEYLELITNMKDEKPKWAQPRNFQFEIAPDLKISVQHWVRNRRVTFSHIFESYKPKSARTTPDRWITSSGVIVNQNDIGNAYEYGDKLVLIEGQKWSVACLKVIAFYPRDQIHPAHLIGDGCSFVFPHPTDQKAVEEFGALLQSLHKNNTVALCARVWQTNCRLGIFVMVPDLERGCLLSVEHCFADDLVPLPTLPPFLIKSENEDGTQKERDNLMDELINQKCIPDFTPERGYINPLVTMVRQSATNKILHTGGEAAESNEVHVMRRKHVDAKLLEQLKVAFPLGSDEAQTTKAIKQEFIIKQENHDEFGQEIKQESTELSEGYFRIKQEIHYVDGNVVGQQLMQEEANLNVKQETDENAQEVKQEFVMLAYGD